MTKSHITLETNSRLQNMQLSTLLLIIICTYLSFLQITDFVFNNCHNLSYWRIIHCLRRGWFFRLRIRSWRHPSQATTFPRLGMVVVDWRDIFYLSIYNHYGSCQLNERRNENCYLNVGGTVKYFVMATFIFSLVLKIKFLLSKI